MYFFLTILSGIKRTVTIKFWKFYENYDVKIKFGLQVGPERVHITEKGQTYRTPAV